MGDVRNTKKIYQATLQQRRPKRRPKARRKDDVGKDRVKTVIVNYRQVVQEGGGWSRANREALILPGATIKEDEGVP